MRPPTYRDVAALVRQGLIAFARGDVYDVAKHTPIEQLLEMVERTQNKLSMLNSRIMFQLQEHMAPEHHTERPDHPFFWYTNSAGELAAFRTDHLLHVLAHDPNNSSIVDFLFSEQGFHLKPTEEYIEGREEEDPVDTLVLTVEQMARLLDTRVPIQEVVELLVDLEFWKHEYILGCIIKHYQEPDHQAYDKRELFDHTSSILFCGASGRIPMSMWFSDPLWDKPTPTEDGEGKEYVNFNRISDIRDAKHERYLATQRNRLRLLEVFRMAAPQGLKALFRVDNCPRRFLRVTSYDNHGCAVSLCRALCMLLRRIYWYTRTELEERTDGKWVGPSPDLPSDSKWVKIYRGYVSEGDVLDDEDGGRHDTAVAQVCMVYRLSQARDAGRDEAPPRRQYPAPPTTFDRFIPNFAFDSSLIERVVNIYLYPTIYLEAWKDWLFINNTSNLHLLFYATFGRKVVPKDGPYNLRSGV